MTDTVDDLRELVSACREALPQSGASPADWMKTAADLALEGIRDGDLREGLRAVIPASRRGDLLRALRTIQQLASSFISGDEAVAAAALDAIAACISEASGRARWLRRRSGDKAQLMSVANREAFDADLPRATAEAGPSQPLILIMGDVDHFKKVNDDFGHPAGDEVLVAVASVVESAVEGRGKAYRYGGEEIAVLLPNHSLEEGLAAAERIRQGVERLTFSKADLRVTISLGVTCIPGDAQNARQLVEVADVALYRAKEGGRNRVEAGGRPATVPSAPPHPDVLTLALQLSESKKAEERRAQVLAMDGPEQAKVLRKSLFSLIAEKAVALEGPSGFSFEVRHDDKGCGVHADRVSISLRWDQRFENSLHDSTLIVREFPVRMMNAGQPTILAIVGKVQPTSETSYAVDWEEPLGWFWRGTSGKRVTSDQLADDVLKRALKAVSRPRDDSDDLLLRAWTT